MELASEISRHAIAGIIYTDIARDGMLSGPNFEAMKEMADSVQVPLIASGGVTTIQDIAKLAALDVEGCVIGRAIYEGHLTLQEAMQAAADGLSGEESAKNLFSN